MIMACVCLVTCLRLLVEPDAPRDNMSALKLMASRSRTALLRPSLTAMARSSSRPLSTVANITVNLTFIDHEGSRVQVPARAGQTLAQVAEMHQIDIGPVVDGDPLEKVHSEVWTEDLFGNGPQFGYDHVMIPLEWRDKMPAATELELETLGDYWSDDDITASSRLASQVKITSQLEGMTVFVPDGIPADIP